MMFNTHNTDFQAILTSYSQSSESRGEDEICQQLFDCAMTIFSRKKVLRTLAAEALVALLHQCEPETFLQHIGELSVPKQLDFLLLSTSMP